MFRYLGGCYYSEKYFKKKPGIILTENGFRLFLLYYPTHTNENIFFKLLEGTL